MRVTVTILFPFHVNSLGQFSEYSLFLDELSLMNDLMVPNQGRTKPHLRKAKPNHVLKPFFPSGSCHLSSRWLTQEYTLDFI